MKNYILHLETSTQVCSVGLSLNGELIALKEVTLSTNSDWKDSDSDGGSSNREDNNLTHKFASGWSNCNFL